MVPQLLFWFSIGSTNVAEGFDFAQFRHGTLPNHAYLYEKRTEIIVISVLRTPSGARRLLATSPRECRSRHLWRCGSTTEVTLPKFESTNGVDCSGADVVLHQQNMSRVMIGANLCADLSSLYSLHAPRTAAPKQKSEKLSFLASVPPQGLEPWTPTLRVSCSTN